MTRGFSIPALGASALFVSLAGAAAQSVGPDEAFQPNGTVAQAIVLSAAQKSAIYNAVNGQKMRTSASRMSFAIGAPVPPSTELRELPDQAFAGSPYLDGTPALLKYATVEDQIVVVDPVTMRVVYVIRGNTAP
jgi:hypothetical protein